MTSETPISGWTAFIRSHCAISLRAPTDWITGLRKGDEQLWGHVECVGRQALHSCSKRRMRDGWQAFTDEELEDLLGEVRTKLLARVQNNAFTFQGNCFEVFVWTMCINETISKIRQLKRREETPLDDTLVTVTAADAGTERRQFYTMLDACLEQLNERYRQISAWFAGGMGPSWIARQLDMTPGSVSVRWVEIRRRLKRCLVEAGYPG